LFQAITLDGWWTELRDEIRASARVRASSNLVPFRHYGQLTGGCVGSVDAFYRRLAAAP